MGMDPNEKGMLIGCLVGVIAVMACAGGWFFLIAAAVKYSGIWAN